MNFSYKFNTRRLGRNALRYLNCIQIPVRAASFTSFIVPATPMGLVSVPAVDSSAGLPEAGPWTCHLQPRAPGAIPPRFWGPRGTFLPTLGSQVPKAFPAGRGRHSNLAARVCEAGRPAGPREGGRGARRSGKHKARAPANAGGRLGARARAGPRGGVLQRPREEGAPELSRRPAASGARVGASAGAGPEGGRGR